MCVYLMANEGSIRKMMTNYFYENIYFKTTMFLFVFLIEKLCC